MIHPKSGQHQSVGWGPRLGKREEAGWVPVFISLYFLATDAMPWLAQGFPPDPEPKEIFSFLPSVALVRILYYSNQTHC